MLYATILRPAILAPVLPSGHLMMLGETGQGCDCWPESGRIIIAREERIQNNAPSTQVWERRARPASPSENGLATRRRTYRCTARYIAPFPARFCKL